MCIAIIQIILVFADLLAIIINLSFKSPKTILKNNVRHVVQFYHVIISWCSQNTNREYTVKIKMLMSV